MLAVRYAWKILIPCDMRYPSRCLSIAVSLNNYSWNCCQQLVSGAEMHAGSKAPRSPFGAYHTSLQANQDIQPDQCGTVMCKVSDTVEARQHAVSIPLGTVDLEADVNPTGGPALLTTAVHRY